MDQNKTCLEMAFELARSGEFSNLDLLDVVFAIKVIQPRSWTVPRSGDRCAS